jgi:putative nucleotidyltransferase with HDIG domain
MDFLRNSHNLNLILNPIADKNCSSGIREGKIEIGGWKFGIYYLKLTENNQLSTRHLETTSKGGTMSAHPHPGITRDEALHLMRKHLTTENLQKHSLSTEVIMRHLARNLGEDEELWGIAGLLHDLDYEETKDDMPRHTLRTEEILKERGVCREIIEAIKGHNADTLGYRRENPIDHALTCAECITGMIVATTLVYPDKKLSSVKPQSIIKRMKQKEFARSVNREYIKECEKIGIPLEEFAELSLKAMCEIHEELGL